jgi:D-alanyl-D-alanine dipeptidase
MIRKTFSINKRLLLFLIPLACISGERSFSQVNLPASRTVEKIVEEKPKDIPSRWKALIGEYAHNADTVYIMERDGALHILTKRLQSFRLLEVQDNVFTLIHEPFAGDTLITFNRDARRQVTSFSIGRLELRRLVIGGENGATFKITPLKRITVLREEALNARPPQEKEDFLPSDLIDVKKLDATIKLDIRYATNNNFMGEVFYSQPRAFLQRPAAEALLRAHRALKNHGYGILIHDAYRPWFVTKMFWDATPNDKKIFVADPSKGSRHNRGCAADVSLYDLATGNPVEIVSGYDEFSDRAFPQYPGGTSLQRWHRELLRTAMEAEGFHVYDWEWWHFDYKDWKRYPIGNTSFESIH